MGRRGPRSGLQCQTLEEVSLILWKERGCRVLQKGVGTPGWLLDLGAGAEKSTHVCTRMVVCLQDGMLGRDLQGKGRGLVLSLCQRCG